MPPRPRPEATAAEEVGGSSQGAEPEESPEEVPGEPADHQAQPVEPEGPSPPQGPFAGAIAHYGETVGLAVGLFAECSRWWDAFAFAFAHLRARKARKNTGIVTKEHQLQTTFYHSTVRHWGSLAAREHARLRLSVARDISGPTIAKQKSLFRRRQEYSAQRLVESGCLSRPYSGRGFTAMD